MSSRSRPSASVRSFALIFLLSTLAFGGTPPPSAAAAGLAWEIESVHMPITIWANRTAFATVVIRNVGTATWSERTHDRLAYHVLDAHGKVVEFDGQRTILTSPVHPGEAVKLRARVSGPAVAGRFIVEWEPLRENVAWFGPPRNGGARARVTRWSLWRAATIGVLLSFLGLAVAASVPWLSRQEPIERTSASDRGDGSALKGLTTKGAGLALEGVWVVWAWLGVTLSVVMFSEFSGLELHGRSYSFAVSGAALLVLPLTALPRRARPWTAGGLMTLIALLAFGDLLYFAFYGSIIPVGAVASLRNVGELRESIRSLAERREWFLAIPPLATFGMAALFSPVSASRAPSAAVRFGARALGAAAIAVGFWPGFSMMRSTLHEAIGTHVISESRPVRLLGFLNAHVLDVVRKARAVDRRQPVGDEASKIVAWYKERARAIAQGPTPASFGAARGKNLLLIQVESAQGWIVGARVQGQEITPYLDELRTRALYYPHITDQTCQGMTADSEYAILNSQHPLPDESVAFLRADNHFHTIAHALLDTGYSTLSAHPFERGFWNRSVLHPRYGFQRSLFRAELGPGMNEGWGLADGVLFERLVPVFERQKKPFFAFVITLSLHYPFASFPPSLKEMDLSSIKNQNLANYIHGMHYFDRSLRQLIAALDHDGLLENTVVAVYGDHDPRFGFDREMLAIAGYDHVSNGLFSLLDRIPFFVILPHDAAEAGGLDGVHQIDAVGGHVDVAPTLLNFLGVPRPPSFVGRALLPDSGPAYAASPDGGAVTRDYLFVTHGRNVPPDGECLRSADLSRAPRAKCRDFARAATQELIMSRRTVDLDLHRTLAALKVP